MAVVHLLSGTPADEQTVDHLAPLRGLQLSAQADRFHVHYLTDEAEKADLILFADAFGAGMHMESIRRHPLVRRFRDKCFVFCPNAFVIPFLPGVYASIEKRWASNRTRPGFHLGEQQNQLSSYAIPTHSLPYLYSFVGSTANAPVRKTLATISHPRGFLHDTEKEFHRVLHGRMSDVERRNYYNQFVAITSVSKFVLCPRGLGVATIRLIETMRMGRVPVILSDDWMPPLGIDWESFSIRIPENKVSIIPRVLESLEPKSVAMGNRARETWAEWFSDEAAFHRVINWCLDIRASRRVPEAISRLPVYFQMLRPLHLKLALRTGLKPVRDSRSLPRTASRYSS